MVRDSGGMEAAKIRILLELDGAGIAAGTAVATRGIAAFERSTTQTLNRVKTAFNGLGTAQKLLVGFGLGAAVVGTSLQAILGPAIEFESAFAGVRKTVEGTPGQLDGIRQGLLGLSTVMPTSASDLALIAENAGALGVVAPQVLGFTETVAKLGETTNLSFDEASASLARFLNITDGGVADVQAAGNVLVDLGNNSATTEQQILLLSTRMAAAFTVAGASKEEIFGLAAAYSSLGIEAEAGGSALSRIITVIADAAKRGGTELEVLASTAGLVPEQFAAIAKENPVEALRLFNRGLEGIIESGGSITPVLEALGLNGLRVTRALTLGAVSADLVEASLNRASNALERGSALNEEYGKRTETTASRLQILQNRIEAVAIAAGNPLLDGFATSADLLGDAIEAVVIELGPLAGQLQETFSTGAEAVAILYDSIGGPALSAAVAGLAGLLGIATALLGALNSLGPAGFIIAALLLDLARVGPVTAAAVRGVDQLAASLFLLRTGGIQAATGLTATQVALTAVAAVAAIAAAGVLLSLGQSLLEAGRAARQAGTDFEEGFNKALDSGRFINVQEQISNVRDRIEELRGLDQVPDGLATSFDGWGESLKSVNGLLNPFAENTAQAARAELEELEAVLDRNGWTFYGERIAEASDRLGLTQSVVFSTAQELGLLDDVVQGNAFAFQAAVNTINAFVLSAEAAGVSSDEFYQSIIAGTATVSDYAAELGLTAQQLAVVAASVEDVDLEDLVTGEAEDRLAAFSALSDEVRTSIDGMAASVGLSTGQFLDQLGAVNNLAAAHNTLRAAIDGTLSAYALLDQQQRTVTDSATAFSESLNQLDGTPESLIAAAQSMQSLSAESAALAETSAQAADNQLKLYNEFRIVALEAGFSEEAIQRAAVAYGLLDNASLANIQAEGAKLRAENELLKQTIEDLEGEYQITLTGEDLASNVIATAQGNVDAFDSGFYNADLEATDNASAVIAIPQTAISAYTGGTYDASVDATDNASAVIARPQAAISAYTGGTYNPSIDATDNASRVIAIPQGKASGYEGTYNANLTATDNASGIIRTAVGALAGFASKAITLTTNNVVRNSVVNVGGGGGGGSIGRQADGSIIGARRFANGGFEFPNPIKEPVGIANIYKASTRARIHSEPETGGEAYIPLARAKRRRSLGIWYETGRHLGVMNDGGIQTSGRPVAGFAGNNRVVNFVPNIEIQLNAADGASLVEVANLVDGKLDRTLRTLSKELENMRI